MDRYELDSAAWTASKAISELVEHANEASHSVRFMRQVKDGVGDISPELLADFYTLADGLVDVWLDHPQGEPRLGELTPEIFKAVLDSLSTDEQAGTTSVPALS
tara:strand:+ start:191 stop:502 length:312 start_codon:yes stop_codon:yes gene_type:complete